MSRLHPLAVQPGSVMGTLEQVSGNKEPPWAHLTNYRDHMYDLSIIMVFRNSGRTIGRSLQSIDDALRSRDRLRIQLVLVDNGSSDSSTLAAKTYCDQNAFAEYVFEPMEGVSNARNRGLRHAQAHYIGFIDSDDTIASDYFQQLAAALHDGPDIVISPFGQARMSSAQVEAKSLRDALRLLSGWWCCQFIFRAAIRGDLQFRGLCFEDFAYFPVLLSRSQNINVLSSSIYHYHINAGSLTSHHAQWRLAQLDATVTSARLFERIENPRVRRRVLADFMNAKAHLRAVACSFPVLSWRETTRYARYAPAGLLVQAPILMRFTASVLKRRLTQYALGR